MDRVEPVTMSVRSTSLARTAVESLPALQRVAELAARPVRFVAFWVATLLPFTYPPLLAAGVVTTHRLTFVALVCLNAVAFVAGHGYKRPD
jgi:low affinity Fe/Cu permease